MVLARQTSLGSSTTRESRKAEEKNLKNTFNNRPNFYESSSKTFSFPTFDFSWETFMSHIKDDEEKREKIT